MRLAQQWTVLPRAVGNWRHVGLPEHFVRNLAAIGLEKRELFRSGQAGRHHVGILENGTGSLISPIHYCCVDPFEIERVNEGLAHALVPEFLLSCVEVPALRCRRGMVGDDVALDVPLVDRRKVVACRPDA